MVPSLVPLKGSGLAALAACHYLVEVREKIFSVLYKTINAPSIKEIQDANSSSVKELQEAGKEAMKKVGVTGCVVGWVGWLVGVVWQDSGCG